MRSTTKNRGYVRKVREPYRISFIRANHVLEQRSGPGRNDYEIVKVLSAQSADGADREAALFLKI